MKSQNSISLIALTYASYPPSATNCFPATRLNFSDQLPDRRTHKIPQSFHLKFRKDEDHLYRHLKGKPNPGAFLKEHIRNDLENPKDLYAQLFSDIERDYGSMKKFLQICGILSQFRE